MKYVFLLGIVYDFEYQSGKLLANVCFYRRLCMDFIRGLYRIKCSVINNDVRGIQIYWKSVKISFCYPVYYLSPQLTNWKHWSHYRGKKCLPIFRLSDFNLNINGVVGTVLWAAREVLTKCPISSPPEKGVITGAWESALTSVS